MTFKFSSDAHILAFFNLATFKKWAIFSPLSGHPGWQNVWLAKFGWYSHGYGQGDQMTEKCPIFGKSSPNSYLCKKYQSIYIKAQFESPKHLPQIPFKPKNTCNKPCFETAYLVEKVNKMLEQKVAQNGSHLKVALLSKNHPIWSPWLWST